MKKSTYQSGVNYVFNVEMSGISLEKQIEFFQGIQDGTTLKLKQLKERQMLKLLNK